MPIQRDLSIDYAKGLAILLVYLSHSVIYHPINLGTIYNWCYVLLRMISSFNMPMFFFISGLLFAFSSKSNTQVLKDKVKRLLVPYLFTMCIVFAAKKVLPGEMAYNDNEGGNFLLSVFVYGGDRWFVYVLMWVFVLTMPLRPYKSSVWVMGVAIVLTFALACLGIMPRVFLLKDVVRMIPFFMLGMYLNQYYFQMKDLLIKYFLWVLVLFAVLNVVFVTPLSAIRPVKCILLPITGTAFFMAIAFIMGDYYKNKMTHPPKVVRYIEYCGKYSLQFYLFTFAYPLIRVAVVKWFHVTNPFAIIVLVMLLQLVFITALIEITRRIRILKVPMGY